MNEFGYKIRDMVTNGYHYLDVDNYYSVLNGTLDALDISFEADKGHFHFYDDILRDIIFDLELGL